MSPVGMLARSVQRKLYPIELRVELMENDADSFDQDISSLHKRIDTLDSKLNWIIGIQLALEGTIIAAAVGLLLARGL